MRALLFLTFAAVARADEAPPAPPAHHRKTPPTISHDCLLAAGPRQNHSMFKSKDFGDIISSWGVIEAAPPAPFNMDAPQGAGSGEYYMCQEFDDYSFYSVSVGVPSSGGGGRRRRGATSREAYMKRMTETLSSLAQHPADIASKRRRLYGGYGGGGNSVGMCLPSVCSAEDVKIITGALLANVASDLLLSVSQTVAVRRLLLVLAQLRLDRRGGERRRRRPRLPPAPAPRPTRPTRPARRRRRPDTGAAY